MSEQMPSITALRRPRALIRAARLGVQDYRRERDLHRLLGAASSQPLEARLAALLRAEADLEASRRAGGLGYNLSRHLGLLIALLAEAQLGPQGLGAALG